MNPLKSVAAAFGAGALALVSSTMTPPVAASEQVPTYATVDEQPPPAEAKDRRTEGPGPLSRPPETLANTAVGTGGSLRWFESISQAGPLAGAAEPNDRFGSAFVAADFDGDGIDDVVVGSPNETVANKRNTGAITLVPGGIRSFQVEPLWTDARPSETYNQGGPMAGVREAGDRFGAALAAGDFDNDGTPEVVVGAPGEDVNGRRQVGAVTVVPADDAGLIPAASFSFFQSSPEISIPAHHGDQLGAALAVGDFNGDGIDDLAAGIPGDKVGAADRAGSVLVVLGSPFGLQLGTSRVLNQATDASAGRAEPGDRFGQSLATGDINGDGRDDLVIGIPGEDRRAGAFAVLYGNPEGLDGTGVTLSRTSPGVAGPRAVGARLGTAVAAGDLNADGFADVAIGAPFAKVAGSAGAGALNVLYGSDAGLRTNGDQLVSLATNGIVGAPGRGDSLGRSIAIANVSGTRHDDLIIGMPGRRAGGKATAGALVVIRGANKGLSTKGDRIIDLTTAGTVGTPGTGDRLGLSVGAGDFNGDGLLDAAAGAPFDDVHGRVDSGSLVSLDVRVPAPVARTDKRDDQRGRQVHVIYAIPADKSPARVIDQAIRTDVGIIDEWYSTQLGGPNVRWDTENGALDLTVVRLDETEAEIAAGDDAFNVLAALDAKGFADPRKLYLVYYEGRGTRSSVCGVTFSFFISILWLEACGGVYPAFTAFPFGSTYLAVHELTHGFGAVDACAPNDDGTGHVIDDRRDVLYQGPLQRDWTNLTLDPGADDYFHHTNIGCTDIATTGYFS